MILALAISLYAGGPGSGCNPVVGKCGRTQVLFHGTTVENAKRILNSGIKVGAGKKQFDYKMGLGNKVQGQYNYFSTKHEGAKDWATSHSRFDGPTKYAVVRVEVPHTMKMKDDPMSGGDKRTKETVPSSMITHVALYYGRNGGGGEGKGDKLVGYLKGKNMPEEEGFVDKSKNDKFLDFLGKAKEAGVRVSGYFSLDKTNPLFSRAQAMVRFGYLQGKGRWAGGSGFTLTDAGRKAFGR